MNNRLAAIRTQPVNQPNHGLMDCVSQV